MSKKFELEKRINNASGTIQNMILQGREVVLVAVGGGSSSGKTSKVALKIKEAFGENAYLISADDYYRGTAFMQEQAAQGKTLNWDQPEAVEMDLLVSHLQLLRLGGSIKKPIYNVKDGTRLTEMETVQPVKVIIVEGLFVLDDRIANICDLCIFVEIGPHGRMIRRLFRDINRTGQKPVDIFSYFNEIVEPMHEKYIEGTRKNAHIIISNEYDPENEADNAGVFQSQMKFRCVLDEEFLRKSGAVRLGKVEQIDRYFNPLDRNLSETDEIVRIREESGDILFAYKGPRKKDAETLKRPFIQFKIDRKKEEIFKAVYKKVVVIKKERWIYILDGVMFTIDYVLKDREGDWVNIGKFAEFNGEIEDVCPVILKLGLSINDGFKVSYFQM